MLVGNYAKVRNAKRKVSMRTIKRVNNELMRERVNRFIVMNWRPSSRLIHNSSFTNNPR